MKSLFIDMDADADFALALQLQEQLDLEDEQRKREQEARDMQMATELAEADIARDEERNKSYIEDKMLANKLHYEQKPNYRNVAVKNNERSDGIEVINADGQVICYENKRNIKLDFKRRFPQINREAREESSESASGSPPPSAPMSRPTRAPVWRSVFFRVKRRNAKDCKIMRAARVSQPVFIFARHSG